MRLYETATVPMYVTKNKYGFRLNVNNPIVSRALSAYKKERGLPERYPLDDEERVRFEEWFMNTIR